MKESQRLPIIPTDNKQNLGLFRRVVRIDEILRNNVGVQHDSRVSTRKLQSLTNTPFQASPLTISSVQLSEYQHETVFSGASSSEISYSLNHGVLATLLRTRRHR